MLGTLCALITALTYIDAAKVLTQTPAVLTVSPGEEAVLHCNIQSYEGYYVSWYKQVPGGVPQFVLRFVAGTLGFGTGFSSDRFNSKSSSDIYYQFIIKQAEARDSAHYFCQTWDSSASEAVFGQGTKLIVTDSSLAPPVLTVLPPSTDELQTNKATLVCLSSQSIPFADVTWLAGENPVSSGILTSTAVQRPDQSYLISSYLAVQTSDWNMDTVYTCKVSLGQQTSKKNINKSKCSSN
ncbi:immunoglobulin lambda-1 light chain-like isoform X6 [Embiotoca jacksoni]|uniref:immunoglobulin lambda-1 light chain-like isoform X6 n=1 Tax=Embiotoca jacksoni TaxID=100190 RepID=UPI003703A13B